MGNWLSYHCYPPGKGLIPLPASERRVICGGMWSEITLSHCHTPLKRDWRSLCRLCYVFQLFSMKFIIWKVLK